MPRSIGRLSASAPSHHDLFSGVFITSTADSEFSAHTTIPEPDLRTHFLHMASMWMELAVQPVSCIDA